MSKVWRLSKSFLTPKFVENSFTELLKGTVSRHFFTSGFSWINRLWLPIFLYGIKRCFVSSVDLAWGMLYCKTKPWLNLEWPNLERPNLERLNLEIPNIERPNLERDRTSKDWTSKGTEHRMTKPRKRLNVERLNIERLNVERDRTSKDWTSKRTEHRKTEHGRFKII